MARTHGASTSVFHAVADPARRRLIELLDGGEQPVRALTEKFDMTISAISQHLKVLREAGLVLDRRRGRQRLYRLREEGFEDLAAWAMQRCERFWRAKLGRLGDHLNEGRMRT